MGGIPQAERTGYCFGKGKAQGVTVVFWRRGSIASGTYMMTHRNAFIAKPFNFFRCWKSTRCKFGNDLTIWRILTLGLPMARQDKRRN